MLRDSFNDVQDAPTLDELRGDAGVTVAGLPADELRFAADNFRWDEPLDDAELERLSAGVAATRRFIEDGHAGSNGAASTQKRPKWRSSSPRCADGSKIAKRLPNNATPAIASIGSVIFSEPGTGQIIAMTPEVAVARFEDGRIIAIAWGELALDCVRPNPKQVSAG